MDAIQIKIHINNMILYLFQGTQSCVKDIGIERGICTT